MHMRSRTPRHRPTAGRVLALLFLLAAGRILAGEAVAPDMDPLAPAAAPAAMDEEAGPGSTAPDPAPDPTGPDLDPDAGAGKPSDDLPPPPPVDTVAAEEATPPPAPDPDAEGAGPAPPPAPPAVDPAPDLAPGADAPSAADPDIPAAPLDEAPRPSAAEAQAADPAAPAHHADPPTGRPAASSDAEAAAAAPAAPTDADAEIGQLRRMAGAFRTVARQVRPAVVHIRCRLPRTTTDLVRAAESEAAPAPADDAEIPLSMGSGIIIDAEGYVLTSYHVVRNAVEIRVRLADRRWFESELVSFDPLSDLAVLRLPADGLPVAGLGDSDAAEVGDWVLAIGSPLGLQQTVTAGIVSATGRDFSTDRDDPYLSTYNFIQTDAAVYAGGSGGPLLDLDGRVIGITHNQATSVRHDLVRRTTLIERHEGLAFATPINLVKNVLEDMKRGRGAPRGRLGAGLGDVTQEIAVAAAGLDRIRGAQIQFVERDSPAAKAKLRTGDIVLAFGGTPVRNAAHLRGLVACAPVETAIDLGVLRAGERLTIPLVLYVGEVFARDNLLLGLTVMDLNKVTADSLGLDTPQGALVVSVSRESAAARAGIRPGMVIAAVNATPTPDIQAYLKAVRQHLGADELQLAVNVRGRVVFLPLARDEAGRLQPVRRKPEDDTDPAPPADGPDLER